jgi:YfiH family protein
MYGAFRSVAGRNGLELLTCEAFSKEGFIAAFTTRKGGWSPPPFAGLNMGYGVSDEPSNVTHNRTDALDVLGLDPSLATAMRQVHGKRIVEVDSELAGCGGLRHSDAIEATDGLVTALRGAALIATFADCVPVIIADQATKRIGIVHAGWKGTALKAAIDLARAVGFTSANRSLIAAIGPSIGQCCYEVGPDVASLLTASVADANIAEKQGCLFADLGAINEAQLIEIGFDDCNIHRYGGCTSCEKGLFFSHRRDKGRSGRCAAIAAVRAT